MLNIKPTTGPHTTENLSIGGIMRQVIYALIPATLFGLYLFGWPAINLFLITLFSALFFEYFCLKLADKPALPALKDSSALLTAWLLAMSLPPWAPWWVGVIGAGMAIILGKQVYGGLGQNLFNPAMLARVALLISFPLELTTWANVAPWLSETAPDFKTGLHITFMGLDTIDGSTGATVLGYVKTELSQKHPLSVSLADIYNANNAWLGFMRGSLSETSAILLILGGGWLLFKKIITWHIPLSIIVSVALISAVFHTLNPEIYLSPSVHLSSGALMCAAFFIATDYVTSPNTPVGQLIFGSACGLLIFTIRTWGGYPEGAAFAILLMNAFTPLIDHYVKPRIYGRDRQRRPLEL
ncbi:MAG: RnfABCDGE type electron transport complex subunit D [Methylomicrobium sp.]|nr:RnfABCDGE type electron transport complex subunit D [Methylomicrobium sp.]